MRYTNNNTFSAISSWNSVRKNKKKKRGIQLKTTREHGSSLVKLKSEIKWKRLPRPFSRFKDRVFTSPCSARIVYTTLRFCFTRRPVLICRDVTLHVDGVSFREIPFVRSSSRRPFVTADPLIILPWLSRRMRVATLGEQQLANFSGGWWTHPLHKITLRLWYVFARKIPGLTWVSLTVFHHLLYRA